MAILIDPPLWPAHGRLWSHVISDVSLAELHAFAAAHGIPERAFEGDHYDVPAERHAALVAAGARPVAGRELIRALLATGDRLRKRRGDRPLVRVPQVHFPDGTLASVDLVRSDRAVEPSLVFAVVTVLRDDAGDTALVFSTRRNEWSPPGGIAESGESPRAAAVREIAEECGLILAESDLAPAGYERFDPVAPFTDSTRQLSQVFTARVPGRRPLGPVAAAELADTPRREWVSVEEAERRCAAAFWWPLAAAVLRGDR